MPEALFPPIRRTRCRHTVSRRPASNQKSSIILLTPWHLAVNDTCQLGQRRSTYSALQRIFCLYRRRANIPMTGTAPTIGIQQHLNADRNYPAYLYEPGSRVANPAQSLHALTVGSVAYGSFQANGWKTFADQQSYPSAFSRSGLGIWDSLKPEVVEYAGDDLQSMDGPPNVNLGGLIPGACPELVRSTMFPPGPLFDRDETGTSFAAPKVARIGAAIQTILPDEPAILYRALIVQSARWPSWAENILTRIRRLRPHEDHRQQLIEQASRIIKLIGYGIPDEQRATQNTDYRTHLLRLENSESKQESVIYTRSECLKS